MSTRRKSFMIAAGAATGAMAAATVIGAGPAGAQEEPATGQTEQTEQAPAEGATDEEAPAGDDAEAPGAECGLDAEAIAEETPEPKDFDGDFPGWVVENVASPCGNLGAVELSTEGATGSSPTKVVLVNAGTPTKTQPEGNTSLSKQFFDFAAVVNAKQAPEGDDPNAEAPQTQSIYVWNPLAGDVVGAPIPAGSSI